MVVAVVAAALEHLGDDASAVAGSTGDADNDLVAVRSKVQVQLQNDVEVAMVAAAVSVVVAVVALALEGGFDTLLGPREACVVVASAHCVSP